MKICNTCNIEKSVDDFYKKHSRCKECTKIHYKENKEKIIEQTNKYYHSNIDISREKRREYYHLNKDELIPKMRKWKEDNKDSLKISNKEWYDKNKDSILHKRAEIYRNNWIEIRKVINNNRKKRLSEDVLFKIKLNISALILISIKNCGFNKKSKTVDILGCSIEEFKSYIECKFEPWMNWNNHGLYNGEFNYGWDIDHIIPISFAKNEEDIIKLNHYTNLQPLCSKINRYIKKDIK